jgi:hypothetical protein
MPGYYDLWTVFYSFLIACLAGFVAFESVDHTRYSKAVRGWVFFGGVTLSERHGCSERAQVVQNENSELKVATAHPPLKCRYRRNHNASFTKTTGIR